MRSRLALLAAIALCVVSGLAVGCGGGDDDDGDDGGDDAANTGLIREGSLTVGSVVPTPPFVEGEQGNYRGFDVELIKAIGAKLSLEPQIEDAKSSKTIFRDLSDGNFDVVAFGVPITPKQEKAVDFTDPYYERGKKLYGLVVATDNDEVREQINGALQQIKDDGTLANLYGKYFKNQSPESVLKATHEPE
jgi:ABC-type amino acid transport substrate-binding protein